MAELTNSEIKKKFEEALNEPTGSHDFVEAMVTRANAITVGREAEKKLAGEYDPKDKYKYASQSVVGRLMMTNKPPRGVTLDEMTSQLENAEEFRELVEQTPDLVHDLKNGNFIKKFNPNKENTLSAGNGTPSLGKAKNAPADPEINAPSIGPAGPRI